MVSYARKQFHMIQTNQSQGGWFSIISGYDYQILVCHDMTSLS